MSHNVFIKKQGADKQKLYLSAPYLCDINFRLTRYVARLSRHVFQIWRSAYFALTAACAAAKRAMGTRNGEQET